MRSKLWPLFAVPMLGGCMMLGADRDGHDCPMCQDDGPLVEACSRDADCGVGERCSAAANRCEPTSTSPGGSSGSCSSDADCPAASYCDALTRQCVEGKACTAEADCPAGFNCDATRGICVPAALPTCGEVEQEIECLERTDCAPLYAGVDCSCGTDCTCRGGDPGCVCASFDFFRCVPAST